MVAPIKNPYHNPYRPESSAASTMNRGPIVDAETTMRTILRSVSRSPESLPSLSTLQTLKEQLLLRRNRNDDSRLSFWSNDLALEFGTVVNKCLARIGTNSNDDGDTSQPQIAVSALLLVILVQSMDEWEDHVVYAVLVQNNKSNNNLDCDEHLLNRLTKSSSQNNENICPYATICLAKAWLCLERLEEYTSLHGGNSSGGFHRQEYKSIPWWMPDESTANALGIRSLQSLDQIYCSSETSNNDEFCLQQQQDLTLSVDQDKHKLSQLTILSILLRHQVLDVFSSPIATTITPSNGVVGCTIPKAKLIQLISKLLKEIQILNHSVMSPSSSEYALPVAILSMSVLSLLQKSLASSENDSLFHGLNQTIQSTDLVDNLVRFVFSSAGDRDGITAAAPRWTSMTSTRFQKNYLQALGFHLFSCWSCCGDTAWKILVATIESKIDSFMHSFCSMLIENHDHTLFEESLRQIMWLFFYMRSPTRQKLNERLETRLATDNESPMINCKETAARQMISSLFGFLRISSGASYSGRLMVARLLRNLLSDRRNLSSNDDMSRVLWKVVDESMVEGHLQAVLEQASTDDVNQPLLLALVDTMGVLLEHHDFCNCLIQKLGAHNVEALIYLVKPNNIRYDFVPGTEEDAADTDTETPPSHNLSRMDEASICIEHEETKPPRGLDHSVRLSVATSLAHLAYGSSVAPADESIGLLISRISTVANDFFMEYNADIDAGIISQTNPNSSMPSMDQIKRFTRLRNRIATSENEDLLSTTLFTGICSRRNTILDHFKLQQETQQKLEAALQREQKAQEQTAKLQHQLRNRSMLFQREMSRFKSTLTQNTRQLVSMHTSERSRAEERSTKLQEEKERATLELQEVKEELHATRAELQATRSTMDELNSTIGNLQQQIHDEKAKAQEVKNELEGNRGVIQLYEEKCDDLQTAIEEREDEITRAEDANQNLQENLEDLFADMCSLAQIHQHSENQETSQKAKHNEAMESLNQKLAREQKNKQELKDKMSDIEEENEKLYRKLGKYKERLEQERNGRREEQERRKEEDHRRKRNGPVSYLNSLHNSTSINESNDRSRSTRSSRNMSSSQKPPSQHKRSASERDRSAYEKENSSNYRSTRSQRRTNY